MRGASMKNPKTAAKTPNIIPRGERAFQSRHPINAYSGTSSPMPRLKYESPAKVSVSGLRSPPISPIRLNALTEVS